VVAWAVVEEAMVVEEALVMAEVLASLMAAAAEMVVSLRARIARRAVLVAAGVVAAAPWDTWEVVRASTCKRPLTSMLGLVAILMPFAPEEISHASSRLAAC